MEIFFREHQYTIQALGVIILPMIALWFAWFQSVSRIKGTISLKSYTTFGYFTPGVIIKNKLIEEVDLVIIAEVRNIGSAKVCVYSGCIEFIIFGRSIFYKLVMPFYKRQRQVV